MKVAKDLKIDTTLANTTQERMYLTQLLNGTDNSAYTCTKIYGDNHGAIAISRNPVNRLRSKHIDIKYHFIRDALSEGRIHVEYFPTEDMIADILTKPVSTVNIVKFKSCMFGNEMCICHTEHGLR